MIIDATDFINLRSIICLVCLGLCIMFTIQMMSTRFHLLVKISYLYAEGIASRQLFKVKVMLEYLFLSMNVF